MWHIDGLSPLNPLFFPLASSLLWFKNDSDIAVWQQTVKYLLIILEKVIKANLKVIFYDFFSFSVIKKEDGR